MSKRLLSSALIGLCLLWADASPAQPRQDRPGGERTPRREGSVARGRYLVQIMDCGGCHTGGALVGQPDPKRYLAGSDIGFAGPWGVAYPSNLTPDSETGLAAWTDEQIIQAIRAGKGRDGQQLAPIMPWASYAALTDRDARAIVAYLRSIAPVKFAAPPNARPGGKPPAPYLDVVQPK